MKKGVKLWAMPSVLVVALSQGGCGSSGNNIVLLRNTGSGSITACFTVNRTVNFALAASNVPANGTAYTRRTAGPMTYNGQAVTGNSSFVTSGNKSYTLSRYWTVTSNGVRLIATVAYTGVYPGGTFLPQNMAPGQTVTDAKGGSPHTFIGFETIRLVGKTFANTCHFKRFTVDGQAVEEWIAPGYGQVKQIFIDEILQYNGDL